MKWNPKSNSEDFENGQKIKSKFAKFPPELPTEQVSKNQNQKPK
jgi:hypothetical protein